MLGPEADAFGFALDELVQDLGLCETIRAAVFDAMFGMAVVKCGVTPADEFRSPGAEKMSPFADLVDFDNWGCDTEATRLEDVRAEWDCYYLSRDYAYDCKLFDHKKLDTMATYWGQWASSRAETLSSEDHVWMEQETLFPRFRMMDVYLPYERVIVTMPADDYMAAIELRTRDWGHDDPDCGPYHHLAMYPVSSNVLPVSPAGRMADLHDLINVQARKYANEADRHKKLALYDARAEEDAGKLRKAPDGDMVPVQSVDRFKEMELGAPMKTRTETMAWLESHFETAAGNPSQLAGTSANAKTLGQQQILQQNQNSDIGFLQGRVESFASAIAGALGFYLWRDETAEAKYFVRRIGPLSGTYQFAPLQKRQGNLEHYKIRVDLYSSLADTPAERWRRTNEFVERILLPMAQIGAQQGKTLDVAAITDLAARGLDIPELGIVWGVAAPQQPGPITGAGGGMAAPPDMGGGQAPQGQSQPSQGEPPPAASQIGAEQ